MPTQVTFSIATTFLFGVDVNGSALPKESGPPIGLARKHHSVTVERIEDDVSPRRGRVRKFNHVERLELLQPLYDAKTLAAFCYEAIDVRKSRIDTEEERLQVESRLRARLRKRAAEAAPIAKRQRMMPLMEYEDDDTSDEDDDSDADDE